MLLVGDEYTINAPPLSLQQQQHQQQHAAAGVMQMQTQTQMLVAEVAEAIGARPAVSRELLGHFLRAGVGDAGKAASLYRTVFDEFLELREMARCGCVSLSFRALFILFICLVYPRCVLVFVFVLMFVCVFVCVFVLFLRPVGCGTVVRYLSYPLLGRRA